MNRKKLLDSLGNEYDNVKRVIRVAGVDENDVDDLTNEVFVEAVKSIDTLKDTNRLGAWVRGIAIKRVSRYYRKRYNNREVSHLVRVEAGEEIDLYDQVVDEDSVEKILQEAEERDLVRELLDTLPEINRRILEMRFWGGYKFTEIADILNVNVNSVKTIYRRSLKRLRENYQDVFGKEE